MTDDEAGQFEQDFARLQRTALLLTDRREISRGPFGTVVKANLTAGTGTTAGDAHHWTGVVAAKFTNLGDAAGKHRLLVEARLMLLMKHEAILPLRAYDASSIQPWMCTSFAKHGDLKT